LIGTDKSGTGKIPNRNRIDIFFAINNTIGGSVTSAANVISGNFGFFSKPRRRDWNDPNY
jgi:hypothetical protein